MFAIPSGVREIFGGRFEFSGGERGHRAAADGVGASLRRGGRGVRHLLRHHPGVHGGRGERPARFQQGGRANSPSMCGACAKQLHLFDDLWRCYTNTYETLS
eukprot:1194518-Prorocentrum_minimum.AAC.1